MKCKVITDKFAPKMQDVFNEMFAKAQVKHIQTGVQSNSVLYWAVFYEGEIKCPPEKKVATGKKPKPKPVVKQKNTSNAPMNKEMPPLMPGEKDG